MNRKVDQIIWGNGDKQSEKKSIELFKEKSKDEQTTNQGKNISIDVMLHPPQFIEDSEDEEELMQEIDEQMEGIVKIAKDVRGYEDEATQKDEEMQDKSSETSGEKNVQDSSGVSKYTKPLRETHSKYL